MLSEREPNTSGLTVVATVSGMLTAQVLKSKLEEAGIAALLQYESAGVVFGFTAPGLRLSEVQILVADIDATQARQVLSMEPPPGWETEAAASLPEP